jgi:flagellar export protein FliJ
MAKFVFKLDPLLEQRRREQRRAQLGVAEIEQERLRLEDELRRRQENLQESRDEVRHLLAPREDGPRRVEADQLRRTAAVSVAADRAARTLAIQLAGVHRRLAQAREQLKLADIRLKAVEQLKERQRLRFEAQQRKREADEMDELAVMRAGRREETDR